MTGAPVPRRRLAVLALVVVVALALPLGTGVAAARSFQGAAGTVVVERGETYRSIDGVAGAVVVRGTVTGDVTGAAGSVYVAGPGRVEGDVAVAAGTVGVDGTVEGDVRASGGTVEVGDGARVGGDFDAGAGSVSVNGTIDGNARIGADRLVLGPNASVGGVLRYDAGTFRRAPGATVAGGIVRDPNLGRGVGTGPVGFRTPAWLGTAYGLLANLLLGVVLLAAFPTFSTRVAERVADAPVASGGVGLLALVGVPIALVVVAITIVGIPLALVGGLAFAIGVWVGIVYGQYAVGAWTLGIFGRESRWLALVVGLVGFALLGAVPVLGGLFDLLALVLGLGALALGLRDAYRDGGRGGETGTGGRQTTLDEVAGDRSVAQD